MIGRATTTCSIYTGTETDDWGDPKDLATLKATGVNIMIMEQKAKAFSENTAIPRIVRTVTGRVASNIDVNDGDRIVDERTDEIYIILNVSKVHNPVRKQDTRLDLHRIT